MTRYEDPFGRATQLRSTRKLHLDGLRGLAALNVTVWHIWQLYARDRMTWNFYIPRAFPFTFIFNGPFMVSIFFVLSGRVLIASAYARARANDEPGSHISALLSCFVRRPMRLILPVYATLFILYVLNLLRIPAIAHPIYDRVVLPNVHKLTVTIFDIRHKLPFPSISDIMWYVWYSDGTKNHLYHYGLLWTMPHELQGSFIIFTFAFLSAQREILGLIAIVLGLYFSITMGSWSSPHFLAGLLLCHIEEGMPSFQKHRPRLRKPYDKIFLGVTVAISLVTWSLFHSELEGPEPFYSWFTAVLSSTTVRVLGATATVIWIDNIKPARDFFSNKSMTFLGRISFGLYVMHGITIYLVPCFVIGIVQWAIPGMPYALLIILGASAGLVACLYMGYAFTRIFDERIIEFTKVCGDLCLYERTRKQYIDWFTTRLRQIAGLDQDIEMTRTS